MRKVKTPQPTDYFYIVRNSDGALLNGIVPNKYHAAVVHWMSRQNFNLARRFVSAEAAQRCIHEYLIADASVIDHLGRVVRG